MTDEIIIDGVDVSKYTLDEIEYKLQHTTKMKIIESYLNTFKQLQRKEQECEELKIKLMQQSEVDTFFNTPIKGWSSDPYGICQYKNEYNRYKQALDDIKQEVRWVAENKKFVKTSDYNRCKDILKIINEVKDD